METHFKNNFKNIAIAFAVAMFFLGCKDTYERVGEEAPPLIFPQGVAENFILTYTETKDKMSNEALENSRVLAILKSPTREDYENLRFPYQTFPNGLQVDFFDEENNKSVITADYGIIYSATNVVNLQGNVVIESEDGKKLEAPQLYWDRNNQWVFTQKKFKYTNPEDGSIMDGEGLDFNMDRSFFSAHKTYGFMMIKEE
ncbi:MAG: LPS export ABC transporter periplasmic protein LptC [Flavobacteriaceae bacterium]|nr:MAG: LPS export ABC transporter periplasmic protein LptC [Flavobacteriaceae bacterium]